MYRYDDDVFLNKIISLFYMKFSLKRESFLLFSNNYSHDIDYSLLYSNRIYLKNSTKQN